jgi:ketosteroid isomerase-like protein
VSTTHFKVAVKGVVMTSERQSHEHARPRAAREAIADIYSVFEEAFLRGDASVIAAGYTDDAQWLVPNVPVIHGKAAIEGVWRQIVGSGGNTLRIEILEVQEAGAWAYEVGRFTASAPDGTVANAGKYIVIWQLQADGTWKTHRDIFNWDVPPEGA